SNDWLAWNTLGAIVLGIALLAVFVVQQRRTSHPTIDISLFANRHFSAGSVAIAVTFFSLTGATFYLAYFLQAVRGYSALAAGVALIAVAAAVMIAAPMSARLSRRFGPRIVTGAGMTIFGVNFCLYVFTTQSMPQWIIEVMMAGMGAGMGLTMSPATNAIMSAVPRAKAGAGSAVNSTVRQVASALGVAVLGSIVAVVFRNHLGAGTPAETAARLDRPAAVVSQLPANLHISSLVTADTSQSIGNALEFVNHSAQVLQQRAAATHASPQQVAAAQAAGRQVLGQFVAESNASFMSAMHIASVFAGLAALLGALIAFAFLPSRREFEQSSAIVEPAVDETPEAVLA
ncbi:MAG TPA: MFS transporter, partial [Jatrophihabitantaceae bacterium]|nr:MFS transporter [Jatrophihabitantaceae bacterium]